MADLAPLLMELREAIRKAPMNRSTIRGAQRKAYPGIYGNPIDIAQQGEALVAPESPNLGELFGVTRADLAKIGNTPGTAKGVIPGMAANPRGSDAADMVMYPANTRRLVNILDATERHAPNLRQGMQGWYAMDPAYERLKELFGPEEAADRYSRLNWLTAMSSPSSDVVTELKRGTAANMLANSGRFDEFERYGGMPLETRQKMGLGDEDFGFPSHAYHSTAQAPAMRNYLEYGEPRMMSPKVPIYGQASNATELGRQTDVPVGDAHFSRGIGLADVRDMRTRRGEEMIPDKSISRGELTQIAPWWRKDVAAKAGLEAVPGQATLWGVLAPHTGVETQVGAPKLEILSDLIFETAQRLKVPLTTARDMVLSGEARAGFAGGGAVKKGVGRLLEELAEKLDTKAIQKGSDIRSTSFDARYAQPHGLTLDELKAKWASMPDEPQLSHGEAIAKQRAELETFLRLRGDHPATAYGTYEAVPGVGLGHFPDLEHAGDAARDAFSAEPSRQWTDPKGRDLIYGALGVPQGPTVSSQGIWQGANGMELNAGHAARPRVQLKPIEDGGGMTDSSKQVMSAAEFTRALLDAQAAGAGHVLDARSPNATALALGLDRPLSRDEAAKLQALGAKLGLPDLVDRGRGVTMTGFESTPTREQLQAAIHSGLGDQASAILGERVVPQGAALDPVFEPVYMQGTAPGSGELTRQWLDKLGEGGIDKLQGSQPFRQRVREKAVGNAERGKRTGAPYRQDLQNLLEIVGDPQQGPASLPDALRRGVALPSALLGAGALYGQGDSDGL